MSLALMLSPSVISYDIHFTYKRLNGSKRYVLMEHVMNTKINKIVTRMYENTENKDLNS